jgi:hypothetical protein
MILSFRTCHPCVWLLHVVRVRRFEVVCTAHGGALWLAAVPLSSALPADDEVFPFYELRAAAVDLRSGEAYVRALYRTPKYSRLGVLDTNKPIFPLCGSAAGHTTSSAQTDSHSRTRHAVPRGTHCSA